MGNTHREGDASAEPHRVRKSHPFPKEAVRTEDTQFMVSFQMLIVQRSYA